MKSSEKINPKVILIGAGPGDPELLTLKAVKALQNAKAVLYDALVNEEILEHAPHAVKLFVGKRKGCHSYMQEQINDLLVAYAHRYGNVVRLKGGDPFVFGRGREEMNHLAEAGISSEVIPGISSALSVPASLGIPVTHRKIAESFWVITGTTSNHQLSEDVVLAAKSKATVVILMGMGKLAEIAEVFRRNGKEHTAVAVVQNGTRENQRSLIGNISNITEKVKQEGLSSPAIIVIGEVVNTVTEKLPALFEDEFIYQNLDIAAISA
ncbi:uroporphyrinogen-III C-methyltransferase [Autumnicola musiva]|uniref:uroporphyrinogen-III C-methyltransferase n=1 Tax=Autumnicola musiva TaxID=3075589 RepID=A0ABU3D559_9FLAO|nr:uroporphyrinogen-III C-methyltransferase [Zunongwangia sp. F117]MDT0676678.1 uroporphyrinogen-III C-methyltransferase [Zunongwangia sp. F117]